MSEENEPVQGIAVIGLAGRFPGAPTVEDFWRNLEGGVGSITFFSAEELAAAGVDPRLLAEERYVRAKGTLAGAELFDSAFFGFTPREAELMDPQHRIFLETAWEALEDAGCDPERAPGRIGLFAGSGPSCYLITNLLPNAGQAGKDERVATAGDLQLLLLNDRDFLATRASYKLNLRGPSVVVQTACSTSLVAVHLACQSLLTGDCDAALAGGVSISTPLSGGYTWQEGGVMSPDGCCRAFDAAAGGSVPGDGCGVVVLKRLVDALADGDAIHAVIRASAVNNDGSAKVGYTAPGVEGQAAVIAESLMMAEVDAASIGYVEAHGSGTTLGDPIEVAALTQAFASAGAPPRSIALGSVKTSVGHCNAAAGIAGLIKTVLALEHGTIPPSLHFTAPNPQIDFAAGPFYVPTAAAPWPETGEPRRAGVSSFGMGGTNVHAVLEQAPPVDAEDHAPSRPWQILPLSARTPAALDAMAARLADQLEISRAALSDIAWTLQTGRRAFEHRRIAVARDVPGAVAALRGARVVSGKRAGAGRPVVFLLPGLGDQYAGMARGLYNGEAVFRAAFDLCAERLKSRLGRDLRTVLFTDTEEPQTNGGPDLRALLRRGAGPDEGSDLHRTLFAQPLCFAVEYALARLVMSWGIEPEAMIGYSVGEYVAACLAGVLSLDDALDLVARRAQLIAELPGGAMLAVPLPEAEVLPLLRDHGAGDLSVAATNGPHLTVVAGPAAAMDGLERRLAERGASTIRLPTTHAFHSAMMRPAVAALTEAVRRVAIKEPEPRIPYLSNVTGDWITGAAIADPGYWARHMEGTVRFAEGAARLLAEPDRVYLELGPGGSLGALLRQHPDAPAGLVAVAALPRTGEGRADIEVLLEAAGRLWIAGAEIDWERLQGIDQGARRRRVRLPAYPFERQRCWIDPPAPGEASAFVAGTETKADVADWFWAPSWHQAPGPHPPAPSPTPSLPPGEGEEATAGSWLIFLDRCGLGESAAARLRAEGCSVVTVAPGTVFSDAESTAFTIDPGRRADYDELIAALRAADRLPQRILHLWGVTKEEPEDEAALTLGLVSLMLLGQALNAAGAVPAAGAPPLRLAAVANGLAEVADGDPVHPAKAAVLGALKVMGQEMPGLVCTVIDVMPDVAGHTGKERVVGQILTEMGVPTEATPKVGEGLAPSRAGGGTGGENRTFPPTREGASPSPTLEIPRETIVAFRGRHRWVRNFAPVRLAVPAVPRLRADGVYLVTDGTHGPGMAIAEHLIRGAGAHVVLVVPPQFPPRERWERWEGLPEVPPGQDVIATAIGRLLALEADGLLDRITLVRSSPTDVAGLRGAFTAARSRPGSDRLRGVFHTAGAFTGGLILLKTREALLAAIDPAVRGARALLAAVSGEMEPPDFILLSSSTLAVAGGLGQIDHAAAGCFLEALALRLAAGTSAMATVAVHWDPYQWGGWLAGAAGAAGGMSPEEVAVNLKSFGVPSDASGDALERLLAAGLPASAVSARDLSALLRETDALSLQALTGQVGHGPRETHPRPGLSTEYTPPGNELEETLAALWQDLFGISPVGIHDSFLELGGHSLLAIQMATQLRAQLSVDLPVTVLFEAPTIAELARRVRQARGEDDPEAMDALLALIEGLSPEETAAKLAEMGL